MYTCMAKEYTLINCMALTENIFFTHVRAKDVCVYREDRSGTAKISEGISIIMYFAEIKGNEQYRKCREMSGSIEITASFPGSHRNC